MFAVVTVFSSLVHGEGLLDADATTRVGTADGEFSVGLAERAGSAAAGLEAGADGAFVDLVLLDDLGADLAGLDDGGTALGEEDSDAAHGGVVGINVTLDGLTLATNLEARAEADVEA